MIDNIHASEADRYIGSSMEYCVSIVNANAILNDTDGLMITYTSVEVKNII